MNNYEILGRFDPDSLLDLMGECGMPAKRAKFQSTIDCVKRTPNALRDKTFYHVVLMDEMLKFIGEAQSEPRSPSFIMSWNNNSPIAPLIAIKNGMALSFDVNVRRGLPFGTFAKIARAYEDALTGVAYHPGF